MLKSRGSAKKASGVGLKQSRCGFATAKKTVSTRTAKKPALKRGPKPKARQIESSSDHTLSDSALESFHATSPTAPRNPASEIRATAKQVGQAITGLASDQETDTDGFVAVKGAEWSVDDFARASSVSAQIARSELLDILGSSGNALEPDKLNKRCDQLKRARSLPAFTGILADLDISPLSPHWRGSHITQIETLAEQLEVYPKLAAYATDHFEITLKSTHKRKNLISLLFDPVVLTTTLETVVQDEDPVKKHQTVFNTLHGLYDPRWIPPQYRNAEKLQIQHASDTPVESLLRTRFVWSLKHEPSTNSAISEDHQYNNKSPHNGQSPEEEQTEEEYQCNFPFDNSTDSIGQSLNSLLKEIATVRKHYMGNKNSGSSKQLPRYLAKLYDLAQDPEFFGTLEEYSKRDITHLTQHFVKSQLASALDKKVKPIIVDEGDYPLIALGRGSANNHPRIRYILPITAMQTFTQFHHLNERWPGCLETFYPNQAQLDRILQCAKLCHHFFGGYAANPVRCEPSFVPKTSDAHSIMTLALKSGLHTVGPPGSGKTALLSTPILLASLCGFPVTIALGSTTKFGVLSINFATMSVTMDYKTSADYQTNTQLYATHLLETLRSTLPPSQPHLLIIDPLEQKKSSNVLDVFNQFYQELATQYPNLLALSAHSTPRLDAANQGKDTPQIVRQFPYLQFTNMELSHDSLQCLFKQVLEHIHLPRDPRQLPQQNGRNKTAALKTELSPITYQDINTAIEIATKLSVPTIRSYQHVLADSKESIKWVLEQEVKLDTDKAVSFTREHTLNDDILDKPLSKKSWVVHSAYSALNTDNGEEKPVTSEFLPYLLPQYREMMASIIGLDEETNFRQFAKTKGSKFQLAADQRWVDITKTIHNTLDSRSRLKNIYTRDLPLEVQVQKTPHSKLVFAKYLNELYGLGEQLATFEGKEGHFVHLSPEFPLFDFAFICPPTPESTSPTHIQFVSLKTGFSRAEVGELYKKGAKELGKYYQNGLKASRSTPRNAKITSEWRFIGQNPRVVNQVGQQFPNNVLYSTNPREDVFGFPGLPTTLSKMVGGSKLFGQMYSKN